MSFLFRIFKKNEEDDETVLSSLAQDIQKRQTKLDDIRLRERRATLAVSVYLTAAYFLYIGIWYMGWGRSSRSQSERALKSAPLVIGPIVVLFVRRIVQLWYNNKGNAEEKTLRELRKKQHSKVEEIKKRTNYYSTRDLLQKYEQQSPSSSPFHTPERGVPVGNRQQPAGAKQSPANPPQPKQAAPNITLSPPVVTTQTRKQWYDKLADAVLGDDGGDSEVARYALICEKCFSHNGLVKENVWEDTQYVCPKCNHFNPSMRAKRQAHSLSPTSPRVASPISPPSPTSSHKPPTSPLASAQNNLVSDESDKQSSSMMEVDS